MRSRRSPRVIEEATRASGLFPDPKKAASLSLGSRPSASRGLAFFLRETCVPPRRLYGAPHVDLLRRRCFACHWLLRPFRGPGQRPRRPAGILLPCPSTIGIRGAKRPLRHARKRRGRGTSKRR